MTVRTGLGAWARSCALAQAGRAADRCSLLLHQAADAAQRAADRALERPGPADALDTHFAPLGWLTTAQTVPRGEVDATGARWVNDAADGLIRDADRLSHLEVLGEDDTHFELWEFARLAWPAEQQGWLALHPAGQQRLSKHVGAMQDRMSAHGLEIVRRTS